ncbi:hypothetical protein HPB50_010216 [Hyalomma asiaticum]|uniref:Uncharacterized protein n=1 Tax=Hyalomma asiaticum TaxID=266040 RepID=A0ACB7RRC3_HYAAI|nr:hypothetical protein HPB50_010216 [Hyalomma asiaticum]
MPTGSSCPTENELRSQRHFALWDEKLARALRLSAVGAPKTEQESWHAVTKDIHVFTAFLVTTRTEKIQITALVRSRDSTAPKRKIQHPPLVCVIRTPNDTIVSKAYLQKVWTWLNPDFTNAMILCPAPNIRYKWDEDTKVAVAVQDSSDEPLKWRQLHRAPEISEEKCCAVCVRPTFGSSMSLWKVVEFVVHYKVMGATKFYFYDLEMTSDMKVLLAWLQSAGVDVTLVSFNLIAHTGRVHEYGQMPALYDCIFRSMSRTEYHIHVDFDEFIVPQRHSSIPAIIAEEEAKNNGSLGSITVPARYYCAEYPLNKVYSAIEHVPLQTRLFTYHSKDFHGGGFSKYIALSRAVSDVRVHSVEVHHKGSSCPTGNERRSQRHFALWDKKLARALRLAAVGAPKAEQESWHAITKDIHVFTAFLVTTRTKKIHITSLVRNRDSTAPKRKIRHPPLVCIIRTPNNTIMSNAYLQEMWTWLNPDFKNALILCPAPNTKHKWDEDTKVAVAVQDSSDEPLKWRQLHRAPERSKEKCCAVCVRPIFGSSMSLWKVVEFVVHYKVMGATKFYFYDLHMTSDMKLLLAWLHSAGVDVTLIPFKLIAGSALVHAEGQMPALYDCIFRSMARTEYYIHVDFDEFIVPQRHSSIPAIIVEEEAKNNGSLGSVTVAAKYYCAEYPLNMAYFDIVHVPLQTRLFTYHSKDFYGGGFSKYIALSRAVSDARVHLVVVHYKGYKRVNAPTSLVFMNHYRQCCRFPPHSAVVAGNVNLRNFSRIADNSSFVKLSARIENDEILRSLRKLIASSDN